MTKSLNLYFLAVVALLGGAVSLQAQQPPLAQDASATNAVVPYKVIDDTRELADSVDQSKFIIRILISSIKPSVHASDIRLTVESTNEGPLQVQIGADGQIHAFPHSDALRRENPPVRSNQPKGTLKVGINWYFPEPETLSFPYRRLAEGVAEVNKAIAKANKLARTYGEHSAFTGKVLGVVVIFPESSAGKAHVEIATANGPLVYKANSRGEVSLKLDKALLSENPQVTLSEKPDYLAPDLR